MGIGLLNIALKQPLPTELSALFVCNILQRRQHVHFAGQASTYDLLQPTSSYSFVFYREKKKTKTICCLLILNVDFLAFPGLLISGYKYKYSRQ